jgi:hypothetical protein
MVYVTVNLNETVSSAWTLGHLARDLAHAEQIKRIRALARLQPSNWREWWEAGEPLFLHKCGGEFQDHPDFQSYNPDT